MRAAVNYTAGKYACFCLKIHQECSEECVAAVVVVVAERQGIAPPHPPFSTSSPLVCWRVSSSSSLSEASGGKADSQEAAMHFRDGRSRN